MTTPILTLASSSPRRKEILRYFSLPFEIQKPTFEERCLSYEGDLLPYIKALSEKKALSISSPLPILSADTIVYQKGKIFEKPANLEEALSMLRTLSGSWHSVYTSLTIAYQGNLYTEIERTEVLLHPLEEYQLQLYHQTMQHADKAGGYAIQQSGSLIVKEIRGCFYNVMGLPINALTPLLKKVGIDLWHYL